MTKLIWWHTALELCTKHNIPLSWKFDTAASVPENTKTANLPLWTLSFRLANTDLDAFHVEKLAFVSFCCKFNLSWFWRSQIILTILWVPSSQKSLVSRTDIWQRIKQSYKQNLCTSKLAWALCLHCLYLCLLYCIQVKRAAVPSQCLLLFHLCVWAFTSKFTHSKAARMYDFRSIVAILLCTFNFNVIHQ